MMKLYWRLVFRPYWRQILLVTGTIFVSSTLDIVSIGLIAPVLDALLQAEADAVPTGVRVLQRLVTVVGLVATRESVVTAAVLLLILLVTAKNALVLFQTWLVQHLGASVELTFNVRMFDAFMRARYDEITRRGRGAILRDLTEASGAVAGSVTNAAALLNAAILLLAGAALLVYLAGWAVPIVAVPLALVYWYVGPALQKRSREQGAQLHEIRQQHSVAMVDFLDGVRVIKTHAMEDTATARIESLLRRHLPLYVASRLLPAIPSAFFEIVSAALVALLIVLMVRVPQLGLSVSSLAAMLLLIRRLLPAITALNENLINLSRGLPVVQLSDEVVSRMPAEPVGGRSVPTPLSTIEFRDVSFRYPGPPDRGTVLHQVRLTLRRGEVTALVGQTGAGKSTIADLIVRFYDPEAGSVLVNGVDLRELDLAAWRRRVGYVGQDTYLFHATVGDNITLWDEGVGQADVVRAARMARLERCVTQLPEGYESVVGDRGLRLSGGQRQRVAIARAMLSDRDVLIFDEATSALDNLTEQEIQQVIDEQRQRAIVLVIAHRLGTIQAADQVVVLDEGRIVERGTPAELMRLRGSFWRLYAAEPVHPGATL